MPSSSSIRIAIPEPASPQFVEDAIAYNQRSLPQYLHAIHSAGATPILIPLHETQDRVAKILATCQGIVLPGSGADIDPQKYGEAAVAACGAADPARAAVDELLIQDAFNLHKPILAICHGAQAINVWCGGSLVQDIPSQLRTQVNHAPGRTVMEAHAVEITADTHLAGLMPQRDAGHTEGLAFRLPHPHQIEPALHDQAGDLYVNSSHHQAIQTPGDNLVIAARCPEDGVIEAVELASRGPYAHWVVAVQWHPERSYDQSAFSRAIFGAFVQAAGAWTPRKIEESILA